MGIIIGFLPAALLNWVLSGFSGLALVNVSIPEQIRTDRLLIRRWQHNDAESLEIATSMTKSELQDWMPGFLSDLDNVKGFLAKVDLLFDQGKYYGYAISRECEILGAISVKMEAGEPEVSYWVRSDVTGKGFATEALTALCCAVFRGDRLQVIHLRCDKANSKS